MLDRPPESAHRTRETFPPVVLLRTLSNGAFLLEGDGGRQLRATRRPGGYTISWEGVAFGLLEDDLAGAGGFVLRAGDTKDGRVLGRTTRSLRADEGQGTVSLLLEDGSLYRIVTRGLARPRFELLSWEVDGAYLVASPDGDAWRILRTPAGLEWRAGVEALVLFGAEILTRARLSP